MKENNIKNVETTKILFTQSQMHGFVWENEIKEKVFKLPSEKNNCDIHDIPAVKNIFDNTENISIKTTKNNTIDCADILRFYDYDFETEKNTIIVIQYIQNNNFKIIKSTYEINYNKELHKLLFGSVTKDKLIEYIEYIKQIPNGKASKEVSKEYIKKKKELQKNNNMTINISPKVDSKKQRRVQCSIPNFNNLPSHLINKYDGAIVRNINITQKIESKQRILK